MRYVRLRIRDMQALQEIRFPGIYGVGGGRFIVGLGTRRRQRQRCFGAAHLDSTKQRRLLADGRKLEVGKCWWGAVHGESVDCTGKSSADVETTLRVSAKPPKIDGEVVVE